MHGGTGALNDNGLEAYLLSCGVPRRASLSASILVVRFPMLWSGLANSRSTHAKRMSVRVRQKAEDPYVSRTEASVACTLDKLAPSSKKSMLPVLTAA